MFDLRAWTVEQAWTYLLAVLAWLAGWVVVVARYGGDETVTTPGQAVGLAAMFGACLLIARTAWALSLASEGEVRTGSPRFVRFLGTVAVCTWLLLLGAGIPTAVRAIWTRWRGPG